MDYERIKNEFSRGDTSYFIPLFIEHRRTNKDLKLFSSLIGHNFTQTYDFLKNNGNDPHFGMYYHRPEDTGRFSRPSPIRRVEYILHGSEQDLLGAPMGDTCRFFIFKHNEEEYRLPLNWNRRLGFSLFFEILARMVSIWKTQIALIPKKKDPDPNADIHKNTIIDIYNIMADSYLDKQGGKIFDHFKLYIALDKVRSIGHLQNTKCNRIRDAFRYMLNASNYHILMTHAASKDRKSVV